MLSDRENLEQHLIDSLRCEFPVFADFQNFVHQQWKSIGYKAGIDNTAAWPRDVRVCVLNNLDLTSILRLARTCKTWAAVINSHRYDDYWMGRYRRDLADYPPSKPVPTFKTEITQQQSKKVRQRYQRKTALWFDMYQFAWCRSKHIMPLNRRVPRTFIEHKRPNKVLPKDFPKLIYTERYNWDENRRMVQVPIRYHGEWAAFIPRAIRVFHHNKMSADTLIQVLIDVIDATSIGVRKVAQEPWHPVYSLDGSKGTDLWDYMEEGPLKERLSWIRCQLVNGRDPLTVTYPMLFCALKRGVKPPTKEALLQHHWEQVTGVTAGK